MAKTGSKNNPIARSEAKKIFFDGKVVVPVLYIDSEKNRKYMSAKFEDSGDLVCDHDKIPMTWGKISG